MIDTIASIGGFIVVAAATTGMLYLFVSVIIYDIKCHKDRKAFDAEYWPRRYAQIAAERRYRDIPARLDQWQKERAT